MMDIFTHLMDITTTVHAAALLDGHTHSLFERKAVVTNTALHTGLVSLAGRGAMQILTGGLAA